MKKRFLLTVALVCAVFGFYAFTVNETSVKMDAASAEYLPCESCPRGAERIPQTSWTTVQWIDNCIVKQKITYLCDHPNPAVLDILIDCYRIGPYELVDPSQCP